MKLDGIALVQTTETKHQQGGVHIYGVVPHPKMSEVDFINSYLTYLVNKDYDYVGFLGPDIEFKNRRVLQDLALGIGRWHLDIISPECAEDLVTHGMALRDTFLYDMLHPECWMTTPDTVRAILNEYGYFLDPRYESLRYGVKDLVHRIEHIGRTSGLHRGVEFYGPKEPEGTADDKERYMNSYVIRTSGEEEDSEPLEHEDYDEQE